MARKVVSSYHEVEKRRWLKARKLLVTESRSSTDSYKDNDVNPVVASTAVEMLSAVSWRGFRGIMAY